MTFNYLSVRRTIVYYLYVCLFVCFSKKYQSFQNHIGHVHMFMYYRTVPIPICYMLPHSKAIPKTYDPANEV